MTETTATWPSDADLTRCVRCGFCLQACPTFTATGLETESPRGRLYLMRALAEDVIVPRENVLGHLDQCLQCRNCEAVCPSGVPYGRIMEQTRARILESKDSPPQWTARAFFLREVIAGPARMAIFASGLRFAQRTGLQALGESLPGLGGSAVLAPRIARRPFTQRGTLADPPGADRRVAMLTGCIMPYAYPRVHRATVRVLARNRCAVTAPEGQVCCGALHAHAGDLRTARKLARKNIDAFLADGAEAVIVNSAGCGAAMKEYSELLANDPAYRDRAHIFSSRVRDVSEFLAELPFEPPAGRVEANVTYQDPCHLAHAQGITLAPRTILRSVPGLTLTEMARPDRCCGSAGVYSLTQPQMSLTLLDDKMGDIRSTGATTVVTANPGCMAQIRAGFRRERMSGKVLHLAELLDRAYRAG